MSSSSVLALALVAALGGVARADKATADVAFNEAKRLMGEGKVAEACPKFELSQQEDPQLGTQLNLADCHERLGKLATAWAEFREAMETAKNRGDNREAFARERSEKLAPRISHVKLTRRGGVEDVRVQIDGRDQTALVGVAVPIDPGKHVIATRVGSGPEATTTIEIVKEHSELEIVVPIENDEPATPSSGRGRTRKIAAIATAGGGLVLAGIGLYFGKRAFDQYDDSHKYCDANNRCDPTGQGLIDDAKSSALKSDVFIVLGAAAVVGGAVLWFTAPKEHPTPAVTARPVVTPTVVGGALSVTF